MEPQTAPPFFQLTRNGLSYAARTLLGCLIVWWTLSYVNDIHKVWALISVIVVTDTNRDALRTAMISRIINTTIGVVGIFDVATDWGLPEAHRDFGETLGVYGVPPGTYLVLPFRGPSAVRDLAGSYVDGYFTPLRYARYSGRNYVGLVRSSLGSIDNRSANIVTYRDIERASVDYYATMRAYYLQRRARQVEEKSVQTAELPDF